MRDELPSGTYFAETKDPFGRLPTGTIVTIPIRHQCGFEIDAVSFEITRVTDPSRSVIDDEGKANFLYSLLRFEDEDGAEKMWRHHANCKYLPGKKWHFGFEGGWT